MVYVNFTSSHHIVPRRPSICKQVVLIKAIHTCRVNVPVPGTFSMSVQAVATCAGYSNVKEKTPDAKAGRVLGVSVPFCCSRGGKLAVGESDPSLASLEMPLGCSCDLRFLRLTLLSRQHSLRVIFGNIVDG